jgi:hypothetical protein
MSLFVIEHLAAHIAKVDVVTSAQKLLVRVAGEGQGEAVVPDAQAQDEIKDVLKRYSGRRLSELKEAVDQVWRTGGENA